MKLPSIKPLVAYLHKHLKHIAAGVILIALCLGAFFGWKYYQYRQTAQFAFEKLQADLNGANLRSLAGRVDFNALTGHLAGAIAATYPFLRKGPDQVTTLRNAIQAVLLDRMMKKEEPPKEEPDPAKLLQLPLTVLPADFLTQFKGTLAMAPAQKDIDKSVLLSASVVHPLLNHTFSLLLRMDRTQAGWKVRDLINAEEVVQEFREAQLKRMEARRNVVVRKNADTKARMDQIMPILGCTVGSAVISDGRTLLTMINVLARNIGKVAVNNNNVEAKFVDAQGNLVFERNLNATEHTQPGEDFDKRWTVESDISDELGKKILQAGDLTCVAVWRTMGLGSGEVLHIAEVPEPVEDFK
ncbi:MAG: translation initiation factor IF-2 [Desulfovibrio sp.]|jgi:hypothetical protein|nr:translation initiation factor IF-2 [Desulfovibrio sp.]